MRLKGKPSWFTLLFVGVLALSLSAPLAVLLGAGQGFLGAVSTMSLGMTLAALLVYTRDTHSISAVTQRQWQRANLIPVTYEIRDKIVDGKPRTMFHLVNPSSLCVRVKVKCCFMVEGKAVYDRPDFSGLDTWYIFPGQQVQGWFAVEALVASAGLNLPQAVARQAVVEREKFVTMSLQLFLRDELDNRRDLPVRNMFYDFEKNCWIPLLTQRDDWVLE